MGLGRAAGAGAGLGREPVKASIFERIKGFFRDLFNVNEDLTGRTNPLAEVKVSGENANSSSPGLKTVKAPEMTPVEILAQSIKTTDIMKILGAGVLGAITRNPLPLFYIGRVVSNIRGRANAKLAGLQNTKIPPDRPDTRSRQNALKRNIVVTKESLRRMRSLNKRMTRVKGMVNRFAQKAPKIQALIGRITEEKRIVILREVSSGLKNSGIPAARANALAQRAIQETGVKNIGKALLRGFQLWGKERT